MTPFNAERRKRGQQMTTDYEHAYATGRDSAMDGPSLSDDEHPGDDERVASAEDPVGSGDSAGAEDPVGSGEDPSSAEDLTDSAEDEDDDQIILARSDDPAGPEAQDGEPEDRHDPEAPDGAGEDAADDHDAANGDEVPDAPVNSDLVTAEPASTYTDGTAAAGSYPDSADLDSASPGDADEGSDTPENSEPVRAVPAPAHSRAPGDAEPGGGTGLAGDAEEMYRRWAAIQSSFVDDHRGSVADAAAFLKETVTALVASVEQRERELRGEWDSGELDTEGLRKVFRRYRGALERIAAM
jgi:hypothetical protein